MDYTRSTLPEVSAETLRSAIEQDCQNRQTTYRLTRIVHIVTACLAVVLLLPGIKIFMLRGAAAITGLFSLAVAIVTLFSKREICTPDTHPIVRQYGSPETIARRMYQSRQIVCQCPGLFVTEDCLCKDPATLDIAFFDGIRKIDRLLEVGQGHHDLYLRITEQGGRKLRWELLTDDSTSDQIMQTISALAARANPGCEVILKVKKERYIPPNDGRND